MNGELEKRSPFLIRLSVGQRDRSLKVVVSKPEINITMGSSTKILLFWPHPRRI